MRKPWSRRPADNRATVVSARKGEWATIIAAVLGGIGVITAALITRSSPQPAASPAASPVVQAAKCSPASAAENIPPGQLLGQGLLVLEGNGTAYDLDAVNCGWDPLAGHTWVAQNIEYGPTGNSGKPIIDITDSPASNVLMGTRGPWDYQACMNARWDPSYVDNPNPVTGAALRVGEGICIKTEDTETKTDGTHVVLLQIRAVNSREVTAWVTVWY
jgi:hypothetical protein